MKPILQYNDEKRVKKNMWASDFQKLSIDILLALKGVEQTNKTEWNETLKMAAGKGVELQMLDILKQNGLVENTYTQDGDSFSIERLGVPITMKFDALAKKSSIKVIDGIQIKNGTVELNEGEPIEVKSINNKNSFDIQKYIEGKPRESYVGQLAIYMDALNKDRGHLFVTSIDGLYYFWFVCEKIGEGIYKCGEVTVNLHNEYIRWSQLWRLKDTEEIPDDMWKEEIYKIPPEKVDWTKLSTSAIGEARNNRKVIGSENSWKILYSPYADLIIQNQNSQRGYTEEELTIIREKTAGYSKKK